MKFKSKELCYRLAFRHSFQNIDDAEKHVGLYAHFVTNKNKQRFRIYTVLS